MAKGCSTVRNTVCFTPLCAPPPPCVPVISQCTARIVTVRCVRFRQVPTARRNRFRCMRSAKNSRRITATTPRAPSACRLSRCATSMFTGRASRSKTPIPAWYRSFSRCCAKARPFPCTKAACRSATSSMFRTSYRPICWRSIRPCRQAKSSTSAPARFPPLPTLPGHRPWPWALRHVSRIAVNSASATFSAATPTFHTPVPSSACKHRSIWNKA